MQFPKTFSCNRSLWISNIFVLSWFSLLQLDYHKAFFLFFFFFKKIYQKLMQTFILTFVNLLAETANPNGTYRLLQSLLIKMSQKYTSVFQKYNTLLHILLYMTYACCDNRHSIAILSFYCLFFKTEKLIKSRWCTVTFLAVYHCPVMFRLWRNYHKDTRYHDILLLFDSKSPSTGT